MNIVMLTGRLKELIRKTSQRGNEYGIVRLDHNRVDWKGDLEHHYLEFLVFQKNYELCTRLKPKTMVEARGHLKCSIMAGKEGRGSWNKQEFVCEEIRRAWMGEDEWTEVQEGLDDTVPADDFDDIPF